MQHIIELYKSSFGGLSRNVWLFSVALIISPLITSWLIQNYDYTVTWFVIGTLPILGGLGMYYLHRINE